MKWTCLLLAASVVLMAAGCKRTRAGGGPDGSMAQSVDSRPVPPGVALADDETAKRIHAAAVPFLEGVNLRLRQVEFVNVAKPIPIRNGRAEAVYVQFYCINNYAEEERHQADLLVIEDGKVIEHFRNKDKISDRLSSTWYNKNPRPRWPDLKPRQPSD